MAQDAHDTTRRRGQEAETLAADFLVRQGLSVLHRNFRVRGGEIDLVCRDGQTLVFVEVRLRTHAGFGGARESIQTHKQRRIALAARHYLARCRTEVKARFDVVLLDHLSLEAIEWIQDAFDVA